MEHKCMSVGKKLSCKKRRKNSCRFSGQGSGAAALVGVDALATSPDDFRVAAAREDGSLEICLVSPGAVGWHCQLTIHGAPNSRVSSLVWCHSSGFGSFGRLFSSGIDGSISE